MGEKNMKKEIIEKDKGKNKKGDKKNDDYMAFLGMMATLDLLVVK
ncbi:hypothetical protein B2H94_02030 [Clostridium sporogenes]|jgi:hypothetical protein|uniref:Uncharacterized protein n=2 Tax=Clostridium TaxID=1485 RepID=A0AAE5C7J8_CLOSG|nr:hypothetical protein RSJ11_05795 [Clostridium sporogenes]AVQ44979.1 hypothetical protein C7M60_03935 [Clostridium botulinum]EDU38626.1 hypothetical protein CLOSPO_01488 [Clostridium sporogenes ATCC 15579]MBE6077073.1 hypothetical protein [Clostridium lundense]MCW7999108.1 hypothetical protein [Clostridium sp. cpc1]